MASGPEGRSALVPQGRSALSTAPAPVIDSAPCPGRTGPGAARPSPGAAPPVRPGPAHRPDAAGQQGPNGPFRTASGGLYFGEIPSPWKAP